LYAICDAIALRTMLKPGPLMVDEVHVTVLVLVQLVNGYRPRIWRVTRR